MKNGTLFDKPGKNKIILNPGYYFFEVWGAQGGVGYQYHSPVTPGYGGFSNGTLHLFKTTTFYVYVGGKGEKYGVGGFNGGGNSYNDQYSAGGGGASDIRAEKDDLHSRIIVAGGGGGLEFSVSDSYAGAGGGETGGDGYQRSVTYKGATQTSVGEHYGNGQKSSFGIGGTSLLTHSGGGGGG